MCHSPCGNRGSTPHCAVCAPGLLSSLSQAPTGHLPGLCLRFCGHVLCELRDSHTSTGEEPGASPPAHGAALCPSA